MFADFQECHTSRYWACAIISPYMPQAGEKPHKKSNQGFASSKYNSDAKQAAQKLLELAEWGEKQPFDFPADLAENHNKYAWDE